MTSKYIYIFVALFLMVMPGMAWNVTDDFKAGVKEGLALAQLTNATQFNQMIMEIFAGDQKTIDELLRPLELVPGSIYPNSVYTSVGPVHKLDGTPGIPEGGMGGIEQNQQDAKFAAFLAD